MKPLDKALMAAAGNVTAAGPSNPWDLAYCEYQYDTDKLWDVSSGRFVRNPLHGQEANPWGLWFKPDGTKMYIIGTSGDDVNEYNLTTAWDVSTMSFLQKESVVANTVTVTGITFKPDGTKMYTTCRSNDAVQEYDLSTAWDVSTLSYNQSFSVVSQDTAPRDVRFKPDGLKMYVVGDTGNDINEYTLTTAWDVSTASYNQNFSVAGQESTPYSLFFKTDGTRMYVCGAAGDDINEYDLSTAWDISTASYSTRLALSQYTSAPTALYFKSDGTGVYILSPSSDNVIQYSLGVSGFLVRTQETNPTGLWFKPDGTKMYVTGSASDNLNEYNLSTAWDVDTASYSQAFSFAAQEATPEGIFFKSDGLKLYMIGRTGDDVYEYNLSTAWDVSTASYDQSYALPAGRPEGLFFKSDGTKMYVVDANLDDVREYSLSTAWDVSTASYSQALSISGQDGAGTSIFFKSDGTEMYILGYGNDSAYQYSLSTAWDISTASYSKSLSIIEQENLPRAFYFKPDGTQMFLVGPANDDVLVYNFS